MNMKSDLIIWPVGQRVYHLPYIDKKTRYTYAK